MFVGLFCGVCVVLYVLYYKTIYAFIKGVKSIPAFKPGHKGIQPISCIVPFRNEYENIAALVSSFRNQSIDDKYFEVIFVDDHSTDHSFDLLEGLTKGIPNYKVVRSKGTGKKDAINMGVSVARHDYVITTDADCTFGKDWLLVIGNYLHAHRVDMLIGPVEIEPSSSFFSRFQHVDFLSLVTCGAGAAAINKPIMCNGANLVFRKGLYHAVFGDMLNRYASGDDIFLLHSAKKIKAGICFLNSTDAVVKTGPVEDLKQFLNQRVRWASKSKGYTDYYTLYVAWLVFLSNLAAAAMPFTVFWSPVVTVVIGALFVVKSFVDYYLLKQGGSLFNRSVSLHTFVLSQLLYPFYIVFTVFYALFGTVTWKGRGIVDKT